MWLRLFAAAFGPSRAWNENRDKTAARMRELRNTEKAAQRLPTADLYSAFNIQQPKESYETPYHTVLANAPWPYRRTAGLPSVSV